MLLSTDHRLWDQKQVEVHFVERIWYKIRLPTQNHYHHQSSCFRSSSVQFWLILLECYPLVFNVSLFILMFLFQIDKNLYYWHSQKLTAALQLVTWNDDSSWAHTKPKTNVFNKILDNLPIFTILNSNLILNKRCGSVIFQAASWISRIFH